MKQINLKSSLVYGFIFVLLIFIGAQTWYMLNMKDQLDHISSQQLTQTDDNPLFGSASIFDDDFFRAKPRSNQNWDPFDEIRRMQQDMDRIFNDAFGRFNNSSALNNLFGSGHMTPRVDISEKDDHYLVVLDLPGVDDADISVNLEGQALTIEAKQNIQKQNNGGQMLYQERRRGMFSRTLTLPKPVKQGGMKTEVKDGVLEVIILKDV